MIKYKKKYYNMKVWVKTSLRINDKKINDVGIVV